MTDNRTTELRISEPLRGFIRHQSNRAYIDGGQARWLTKIADEIDAKHEQAIAATLGDDAKPCPWCGREMQEGHHDGHVWYRDDSDYIASLKRSIDALQKAHATLGGGECEQVLTDCDDGLIPPFTAHCSACGAEWGFTPKYCHNCGAKCTGTRDERKAVKR